MKLKQRMKEVRSSDKDAVSSVVVAAVIDEVIPVVAVTVVAVPAVAVLVVAAARGISRRR